MLVIEKNCPVVVVPENWSEPIKISTRNVALDVFPGAYRARPRFPAMCEDMPEPQHYGYIVRRSAREWTIILLVCVVPYALMFWALYDALKP